MSVYLPEDLYAQVREHDLPLSQLAQQAISDSLARRGVDLWVTQLRDVPTAKPERTTTEDLMDAVAEDFGA